MREAIETGMPAGDMDVTVVMACYTADRLDQIGAALNSLRQQKLEPREVIVAVDNNPALAECLEVDFPWARIVVNDGERGASATRNRGAAAVGTPLTAFLDDDETADPDWLVELTRPFADPRVIGTGGCYVADWESGKPSWFPEEFGWAVGCSYPGLPGVTSPVRNVWSGNMAVRTESFRSVGGFRSDFGKLGAAAQPEDTDLCIRMAAASAGIWMYVPDARINHRVPADRSTLAFFVSRCFNEGAGKAVMSRNLESGSAIDTERSYVRTTAMAALGKLVSLRARRMVQALVMVLGLTGAALGYLSTRAGLARSRQVTQTGSTALKPAFVAEHDIDEPLDALIGRLPALSGYWRANILLRSSGRPLTMLQVPASVDEIVEAVAAATVAGADVGPVRPVVGTPPSIGVAICTRERPDDLRRVLQSLAAQLVPPVCVLVVDNAPTTDASALVVAEFEAILPDLRYVVESKPGLSQARNRAIACLEVDVIAWIDDDEVADPGWLSELAATFAADPATAVVAGSVIPAELETWAQWWFEQYGGHSKGRGFTPASFHRGDTGTQSPMYPLPAFGAGANMAVRTSALRDVGGFDTGLGAGTATFGGEDTLMFTQMLLRRFTVVYHPAALTRHYHRRSWAELERQMYGYGVGLTAFYAALLRWDRALLLPLLKLLPGALADMLGARESLVTADLPAEFPARLMRLKLQGMVVGPLAYLRARRAARRMGAQVC